MNNSSKDLEDEYPIIWHEPSFELVSEIDKKIHVFCDFQEIVSLAESLKTSFLLIVPNERIKSFSPDYYARRLAEFEEEAIFQRFGVQDDGLKVYVFYTDEDFESEIFVEENTMKWDVKEVARGFREELIFWERKRRGMEDADVDIERCEKSQEFGVLENLCDLWEFGEQEDNFLECKEFCIRGLKNLVNKRKQEKKKLIYYVNLGECCYKLKQYQQALEHYTTAFDIVEQIYGESHPNIAYLYESFARIYYRMKEFEKAKEYGLKTVEIRISVDGEMHPNVALLYESLAYIYSDLKEHEKAAEYYLKAIEIKKYHNSEDIADLYEKVEQAYESLGKFSFQQVGYQKVIEYNVKLLEIRKVIYGEIHQKIVSSYENLGRINIFARRYEKAIEFYLKAIEIKKSESRRPGITLHVLYSDIGDAYKNIKDFAKALEYQLKSLEMKKLIHGETSWWTASSYWKVGLLFRDMREYQNARKYLEKALVLYKFLLKENPSDRSLISGMSDVNDGLKDCQRMIESVVKFYDINI